MDSMSKIAGTHRWTALCWHCDL